MFYLILGVVAVVLVVAMQFAVRGNNAKLRAWAEGRGYEFQLGVTTWRPTLDGRYDGAWFRRYAAFVPFSFHNHQKVYESLVRRDGDLSARVRGAGGERERPASWYC